MSKVAKISAYEVIQSGGRQTIAVEMTLDDGITVKTSVASDEKIAAYQAQELEPSRAVDYINNLIGPKLKGVDVVKQAEVDGWLVTADKTPDRSRLGVNTIWAISCLFAKAQAKSEKKSLFRYLNSIYNKRNPVSPIAVKKIPTAIVPILCRVNKNSFDFKEFCIAPSSSLSFAKSVEMAISIYNATKKINDQNPVTTNLDAFETILSAMASLNLKLAIDAFIALHLEASFYSRGNNYQIKDKQQALKTDEYLDYISGLVKKYFPLFLIDPLPYEDLSTWRKFNETLSKETYLVAGNLAASSLERLKKIVDEKIASSLLVKPAQVGTITEIFDMVAYARKNNIDCIFATSDYETGETIAADIAVASSADFVKFGLPVHGENTAKYNRMLEIEREINKI
jgi:enolase